MSLDPLQLVPSASLNRVRIIDLPGIPLERDIRGSLAFDLLSPEALIAQIHEEAAALGLSPDQLADPALLPIHFDRCFIAADPAIRAAADRVTRRMGHRLAALLLTLRRGDPVNRAARPDWDDSYWAHWAGIDRVWLGGGLMSGRLGPRMRHYAQLTLDTAGQGGCRLHRARHAAALPLIGAARSMPPGAGHAVVLDFGHSYVKRAHATYHGDALVALHLLPAVPTGLGAIRAQPPADSAAQVAEMMVTVLAETWHAARGPGAALAPTLVTSIAAYVAANHPIRTQAGAYVQLHTLADNLGRWLSDQVSGRLGQPVAVTLIHDGTAAARVYAGHRHSAVIVLGTALGVGFPPPQALRPLAPHLQITGT
jgi:hypothetical protein